MRSSPLLLSLALFLAGCASEPSTPAAVPSAPPPDLEAATDATADPDEMPDEAARVDRVVVTFTNGTITSLGAGTSGPPVGFCCLSARLSGQNTEGVFTPEKGLVGIVLELAWTDPTFDLDLWLRGPDYETLLVPEASDEGLRGSRGHSWYDAAGQVGSPDGHVAIVITEPEEVALEGEWGWQLTSKTSNATPFTVVVSLFYGEPPKEGYTAVVAA